MPQRKLMRQTAVAATLSLNVQVYKNGQSQLLTLPLLSLTRLLMVWWQIQLMAARARSWLVQIGHRYRQLRAALVTVAAADIEASLFTVEFPYAAG